MAQFPLSDTQNPEHKHIVGMIQFSHLRLLNLDHKHTVDTTQFPSFWNTNSTT
jgi:hypothetical protein